MAKVPNFDDVIDELNTAPENFVVLELGGQQAFILLAQLQLALRHPGNTGQTADWAREVAGDLEARLSQLGPNLARICKLGWDPNYDERN